MNPIKEMESKCEGVQVFTLVYPPILISVFPCARVCVGKRHHEGHHVQPAADQQ